MCAEGGTGYYHGVTMARSRNVWGPYEPDPCNPIVTSVPENHNERHDWDHLKPRYYNPDVLLQKAGHGSFVETPLGECYLAHLCSRPFVPELRCTLGRETAFQKMCWTEDGWLRMADGGNLAKSDFIPSELPDVPVKAEPELDTFEGKSLSLHYYAPRQDFRRFASLTENPGKLTLRGNESLCSLNEVSLLAKKLTSVRAKIQTKMNFQPENYHQSAGLAIYYDNMNYAYLEKTFSQTLGPVLRVRRLENGVRTDYSEAGISAPNGAVWLLLEVQDRITKFFWSEDGVSYQPIGPEIDTSTFSDEYCKFGEFTGTFVGLACEDSLFHSKTSTFAFFSCQTFAVPDDAWYTESSADTKM